MEQCVGVTCCNWMAQYCVASYDSVVMAQRCGGSYDSTVMAQRCLGHTTVL